MAPAETAPSMFTRIRRRVWGFISRGSYALAPRRFDLLTLAALAHKGALAGEPRKRDCELVDAVMNGGLETTHAADTFGSRRRARSRAR
jgi:hypothetical protein